MTRLVGSPEAGECSAVLYSLLISARHCVVDLEAYLRDVIERLPGCGNKEAALRQLLPENWAAAQKSDSKNLTSQQPPESLSGKSDHRHLTEAAKDHTGPFGPLRVDKCLTTPIS